MRPGNTRRFAELMMALGETFRESVSDLRAELYFDALSDLTIEQVEQAVKLAVRGKTFFPKPSELRELVTGNDSDEAALEWAKVQREVSRIGYMRQPSLSAQTMEAIRVVFGGWKQLCGALPSPESDRAPELMGWRKQFVAAYGDTKRREVRGELTAAEATKALADITERAALQGERA
jgi:hypothetical protein